MFCRRIAEARKEEDFKESDLTIGQTAIEFEDANEAELKTFVPASRLTGKTCYKISVFNDTFLDDAVNGRMLEFRKSPF